MCLYTGHNQTLASTASSQQQKTPSFTSKRNVRRAIIPEASPALMLLDSEHNVIEGNWHTTLSFICLMLNIT
jgi:hypothetical protein